jgi:hypothetical protein
MPKQAQRRIDETITFIVNDIPGAERTAVRNYLNNRVQNYTNGVVAGFSAMMSMTNVPNAGNERQRNLRRAIILIDTVVLNPDPAALPGTGIGVGLLENRYKGLILPLRLMADQNCGTMGLVNRQFDRLYANPIQWLTNNRIHIFGSNVNGVVPMHFFYFYYRGRGYYKIDPTPQPNSPNCYRFNSVNVPAILWSNVPGRTANYNAGSFAQIVPTPLQNADVMTTTQFTGCSFCFKNNGGVNAAHIWPSDVDIPNSGLPVGPGGTSGAQRMAEQLCGTEAPGVTAGDFAAPALAGGNFMVYGAGHSNIVGQNAGYPLVPPNQGYMSVIGLRRGNWTVFSQHVNNNNVTNVVQLM